MQRTEDLSMVDVVVNMMVRFKLQKPFGLRLTKVYYCI